MFVFANSRETRYSNNQSLIELFVKCQTERHSIKIRATKLFNLLNRSGVIPENISEMNINFITNFYHNLKFLYIHQNYELVKHFFGQRPC